MVNKSIIDYHVHSQFSYCSENVTIEKLAECASKKGLKEFYITDHSSHLYFNEEEAWKYEYLKDYSLLEKRAKEGNNRMKEYLSGIHKFRPQGARAGIEVECAFTGEFILEPEYLEEIELVIGAIHHLPCLWGKPGLSEFTHEFLQYTLMLMDKDIDILAHPTRIFRRTNFEIPKKVYAPIIDKAVSQRIALEINSHSQKDPDQSFIEQAIAKGAKLAIGTDTHALKEFGDFSWHFDLLAKCGMKTNEDLQKVLFRIGET
jgi:histidinol phosphatase-like PHP family hydrolase